MPDEVAPKSEIIPANQRDLPERLAALKAGSVVQAVIPTTIEEAWRLALAVVKAGLAPESYNIGGNGADRDQSDPQKVLIGILKSMEVGLPPITGLSTICIVRNRPTIWGDGAVALVQRSGEVVKIEQGFEGTAEGGAADKDPMPGDFKDDFTAVYRIWRKEQSEPYVGRFSVRDAKRAHLWLQPKKPIWMQYPKRMLMARARAFALREGFADALSGLSIREEVDDLPPETPAKTDAGFLEDAAPRPGQKAIAAPTEASMPVTPAETKHPEPAAVEPAKGSPEAAHAAEAPQEIEPVVLPIPTEPGKRNPIKKWPEYLEACRMLASVMPSGPFIEKWLKVNANNLNYLKLADPHGYGLVMTDLQVRREELGAPNPHEGTGGGT